MRDKNKVKPFLVSLLNHERLNHVPFDTQGERIMPRLKLVAWLCADKVLDESVVSVLISTVMNIQIISILDEKREFTL